MLYQRRFSPIHRLNPLTKLVWLGSMTIIAIAGPGWWLPLALLVGIIAPLAIVGQVAGALARYVLLVLAPSVAGIIILQGLLHQPAPTILFDVFGAPFRAEGLRYGVRVGGQLAVVGAASALVLLTTAPSALIADLTRRNAPRALTYILAASLSLVPIMRQRAVAIIAAQRARGLATEGNLLARARAILPLAQPLVFGALVATQERAMALEARGFTIRGPKTTFAVVPDSRAERAGRWAMLGMTVAILAANGLPGWPQ